MTVRYSDCSKCSFCEFAEQGERKIQIGCRIKRLDQYKELQKKVDPHGDPADNRVFKITEMGPIRAYILNLACVYQRSQKWVDEVITQELWNDIPKLREFIYHTIPFNYSAVVVYDGGQRGTLKTIKSIMSNTIQPQSLTVLFPAKYSGDKNNNVQVELGVALKDRLSKDMNAPEDFVWEVRQMVDKSADNLRQQIVESVQTKAGSYYILVLNEGTRLHENFIDSIKKQNIDEFLDFSVISLGPQEALIVHPVFDGTLSITPSSCFVYRNGVLHQDFNISYISAFFNVVQ